LVLSCCHGLSNNQGFLSDSLTAITLMGPDGQEKEYKKDNSTEWKCISGSFGLMGESLLIFLPVFFSNM
jgi:hypothetical protein